MKRLVYAFCQARQQAGLASVSSMLQNTTTYFPILTAALFVALLPQFVRGQCYTLICNQNVQLSLGNDCTGSVNPFYMIQNNWSCQGPMAMVYYDQWGNTVGNTVTSDYLGQTLSVHVTHNWTGLTCWGSVYVTDKKKPVITTGNVTLNCTEDPSVAALGEATATDNCSSAVTLSHQDTVLDFGCGYTGFAGYFAPSNWEVCLINNGDGGVDVSGAPNSVLVEGASNSPLSYNPRYTTKYKIVVPTEGFVSFDWSSFGGSNFDLDAFYLTINNWCVQLSNDTVQGGSYTTGLLHPGDVLSFEQTSDGNADAVHTLLSNFHFHTLAWKVINRKWTAVDEHGNTAVKTQVITLNRAQLSQVVFPPNRDGIQAPMLACGAMADLAVTGQPLVDEDGDLATTSDRFPVENGDCFFSLAHEDQVVPTCEGSGLVLRKWTVFDDCSGQFLEHTQLIKLFDVTPPTLACPSPAVLSTDDFGCSGVINLPPASASDDCSATVNITPYWNFGSGYGPFGGISPGTYTVTYQASDACGNVASCATQLTVQDEVPPTVICDGFTVASLTNNGHAIVYANAVDDGSYDWCCVQSYEIKRQGEPDSAFGPTLYVDCSDLPTNPMVRLRVTDCAGNTNFCDVTVIVHDELAPTIVPPADLTVDCNTGLGDLAAFGLPTVFDNCGFDLSETSSQDFTNCGSGTLTRTFTATDASGNTASAQQVIHFTSLNPWNAGGGGITWPQDFSTPACSGVSLEPFDLPWPYNGPSLAGQSGCESVSVDFHDEVFWISEPACYKVFRTWTVTDWCQFQPNAGGNAGIWQHLQVLEVLDNEPPVFENTPAVITVAGTNGCSGDVSLAAPVVSDCSDHVTLTAAGALGSGFSFQNVPAGLYPMTFTASDGCGNTTDFNFTVSVGDDEAPTASCINGLAVPLNAQGEVMVNAQTFNLGSSDNCTGQGGLSFSFSPDVADAARVFHCNEVGQNLVQLWVTDLGGNADFCETYLMVMANPPVCNDPTVDIGGTINTPSGMPVGQVTVGLGSMAQPLTTQPGTGGFMFEDLPTGGNFTVTPSKNLWPLNGVSSFDLAKINDHILNNNPFTQPWQFIAADANGSGAVTAADLVAIQSLILFNTTAFPNGTPSWKFVPAGYAFANPNNPWPFPQDMPLGNLSQDYLSANFTAIKTGDVSGNANPALVVGGNAPVDLVLGTEAAERSAGAFLLKTKHVQLVEGEVVTLFFDPVGEAAAWQATLEFDPQTLAFVGLGEYTAQPPVLGTGRAAEGVLTALWFGKTQAGRFALTFRVLKNGSLHEVLRATSALTPALAWSPDGQRLDVLLQFDGQPTTVESDALFGCRPNPFSTETAVRFALAAGGEVVFSFYDASGKLLHRTVDSYGPGLQEQRVKRESLATSGLVVFKMETAQGVQVGRIVVE